MGDQNSKRLPRWWSGGICSSIAVTSTHPLDLVKVQLQTQVEKMPVSRIISNIYNNSGLLGFYSGISASWFRQLTYTTSRFAIYEYGKEFVDANNMSAKVQLAAIAGFLGGIVGVPGDVVTVRLQNDIKLPPESRRNYKHVFDGLYRIAKEEGAHSLFRGAVPALTRAVLLTIGTNAAYDQVKQMLLGHFPIKEGLPLHFLTATVAGFIGTLMTQPIDVMKTKYMNAMPGEFSGLAAVAVHTAKQGPLAFYKGFVPALMRVSPNTIITFMLYEQARLRFGYLPPNDAKKS